METTTSGKKVSKYTTAELAQHLLSEEPGTVISLATGLKDSAHDAWPWYSAVIVKLIENYQLFVEPCIKDSDKALVFPLPLFDMYREKHPDEAADSIIRGLNHVAEFFGIETPDTWFIDTDDVSMLYSLHEY